VNNRLNRPKGSYDSICCREDYFSILLNEFDDNEELSSNEMVNKFIETANKVGDKVHARVLCDLKGSVFHCP